MPKTISANEAKNRLGAWLGYVSEQNDEVIVESYGKPKAVIMSISEFEEIEELRVQKRRADALRDLRALRAEVQAQNQDLNQEEADEIANRFSREIIDDMAAEGKITFERDLR
jgi:prevent-host-death family protein